jgi:DNA-binding CsgD family transcriptional regulator
LGRPKGSLRKSKLDGNEGEIKELLKKRVSKASIAKIFDISRPALYSFVKTRDLEQK